MRNLLAVSGKRLAVICLLLTFHGSLIAGGWLKQGTATTIRIGPFIKLSDSTLDSSQTVTNFTVKLIPHSDATGVTVTSFSPTASGGTHDSVLAGTSTGTYELELTATDTATAGRFDIVVTTSGTACYPVFDSFMVVGPDPWEKTIDGDSAAIEDIWAELASSITTTGSIGKQIKDNLDGAVSSTPGLVWDEPQVNHIDSGTFGIYLDATTSSRLAPTVAARTLDVSATGGAGVDWANVESPSTTVVLSNTTISTGQTITSVSGSVGSVVGAVGSVTGAVGSVTGNVGGSVGSVTGAVGSVTGLTASDVGNIKIKTDFLPSATAGASGGVFIAGTNAATTITTGLTTTFTGSLTGSVASVTGAVGSVTGAVGSVAGNVTGNVTGTVSSVTGNVGGNVVGSVNSVTSTVNAAVVSMAANSMTASAAAADFGAELADAVWDEATSGHTTAGTTGKALSDAASAGDPWSTALPGAYIAGEAGYIIGHNIDATVTSRLAPTVAARTLDVSATGEAGIDWANVGSPTTTVDLSGTTIKTTQAIGSVSGAVGSVTGAVGSVTAPVTTGTLSANTITATSIAANAITAAKLDPDVATEIHTGLLSVPKNTIYSNFTFEMVDSATGLTPTTGFVVTCQVSQDGGGLGACTNAVTEIGNGLYKTDIAAADLNADEVWLKFTAAGARRVSFKIRPQR